MNKTFQTQTGKPRTKHGSVNCSSLLAFYMWVVLHRCKGRGNQTLPAVWVTGCATSLELLWGGAEASSCSLVAEGDLCMGLSWLKLSIAFSGL